MSAYFAANAGYGYKQLIQTDVFRNSYLPHRWGILLFTPPPGSRTRRLGWSQCRAIMGLGLGLGCHGVVGGFLAVG